jgi:hypothetical protein
MDEIVNTPVMVKLSFIDRLIPHNGWITKAQIKKENTNPVIILINTSVIDPSLVCIRFKP